MLIFPFKWTYGIGTLAVFKPPWFASTLCGQILKHKILTHFYHPMGSSIYVIGLIKESKDAYHVYISNYKFLKKKWLYDNNYTHEVFFYVGQIFGVYTILPKYQLYSYALKYFNIFVMCLFHITRL